MNLEWVISGKRHIEPSRKKHGKRVAVIVQEQMIVAQWGHCQPNLSIDTPKNRKANVGKNSSFFNIIEKKQTKTKDVVHLTHEQSMLI
jgi:hypothetical protein